MPSRRSAVIGRYPEALSELTDTARANALLSFADREIAGGNAVIPDQQAMYEARARIPVDASYEVAVGVPVKGWSSLTADYARGYTTYFLLPRRPVVGAPLGDLLQLRPQALPGRRRVEGRRGGLDHPEVAVTFRAILGLLTLNALFLAVGSSLVWALCGWTSRSGYARLAGLAYLLGVAALGIVWTLLLVLGIPFGVVTILVSAGLVSGAALIVAYRIGREQPERRGLTRFTWISLVSATGIALVGILSGGVVSRREASRPVRVRRMGILDTEGEGDLLLRGARRAVLRGASRPDVSAVGPDSRRCGFPCNGEC